MNEPTNVPMVQIAPATVTSLSKNQFTPEGNDSPITYYQVVVANPNPTNQFDMAYVFPATEECYNENIETFKPGGKYRLYGAPEVSRGRVRVRINGLESMK